MLIATQLPDQRRRWQIILCRYQPPCVSMTQFACNCGLIDVRYFIINHH
ncbi:hypothetical protein [Thiospirillum jenense]|nr:hypothetical protein [Thiospirillum jenense]